MTALEVFAECLECEQDCSICLCPIFDDEESSDLSLVQDDDLLGGKIGQGHLDSNHTGKNAFKSDNADRPCAIKNCGHVFHLGCLRDSVMERNSCPICRQIPPDGGLTKSNLNQQVHFCSNA